MNRINTLFDNPSARGLLSLYFCAGTPEASDPAALITLLEGKGVDMVEIGIPFSDPMADGPVIQHAATRALRNGCTLRRLIDDLRPVRQSTTIPLLLMGYLNPIMQYGFEALCRDAKAVGVDGFIIPDLPFADYLAEYKPVADRYDLRIIMLITPETSAERIRLIDEHTDGFIYMVSTASTTGAKESFAPSAIDYFSRIDAMHLRNRRMIGFGISNAATFSTACRYAAGAIIGSKFVSLLESEPSPESAVDTLLRAIGR